jgi:hypothetical protein
LEQLLIKLLPLERQLLIFWSKFIVPVLEPRWSFFLYLVSEWIEAFELNQFLHWEPSKIWKPFLNRVGDISFTWTLEKEGHFLFSIIILNDFLLHETESELGTDDWLVSFEQTSGAPLVNCHANHWSESNNSVFLIIEHLSLLNGLEEESGERLKRVLVHWINKA